MKSDKNKVTVDVDMYDWDYLNTHRVLSFTASEASRTHEEKLRTATERTGREVENVWKGKTAVGGVSGGQQGVTRKHKRVSCGAVFLS